MATCNLKEVAHPDVLKAAAAEFFAMIIYVFPIEGCVIVFSKVMTGQMIVAWLTAAISHAFALIVAVSVTSNISGGHINPAVTFGAFVGGHITFCTSVIYWIGQLLGSTVAFLLLKLATGSVVSPYPPTPRKAIIFEIVLTFGLVYTCYATLFDPQKGNMGIIAPIAIGLVVGVNILSGGALHGAAMNPGAKFGQALVSWTWTNHWVYWLGTFVGSAIAALVYEMIFIGKNSTRDQLPPSCFKF